MCGAVSGAIMAINLFTGRNSPEESAERAYTTVRSMLHMFETRFGSTNCRELTGCDLGTEEGHKRFEDNNLIERCRHYVEEATTMAVSLIQEEPGVQ